MTITNTTPADTARDFWSHLDGIAVINLDDRPDRWEELQRQAAALPGAPRIERISAIRGVNLAGFGQRPWFHGKPGDKRWGAKAGCTQSHRKAMAHARQKGWRTFLVLEDDADLTRIDPLIVDDLAAKLFEQHTEWDVCYLGFSRSVGTALELDHFAGFTLCQIDGCYTTHAYLVKEKARDWIFTSLPPDENVWPWLARHRIIDRWYSRWLSTSHTVYCLTPSLVTQISGFSDIVQRSVNYNEDFSGTIPSLTRSRTYFKLRSKLQHLRNWANLLYDTVRAGIKRCNGF